MYTRSYFDSEKEGYTLPGKYDGTAFSEENTDKNATRPPTNDETESKAEPSSSEIGEQTREAWSPLSKVADLGKSLFGGLFGGRLKLPSLGAEEILIIATALFLLFSKDGDMECAILLLLLLLIN